MHEHTRGAGAWVNVSHRTGAVGTGVMVNVSAAVGLQKQPFEAIQPTRAVAIQCDNYVRADIGPLDNHFRPRHFAPPVRWGRGKRNLHLLATHPEHVAQSQRTSDSIAVRVLVPKQQKASPIIKQGQQLRRGGE